MANLPETPDYPAGIYQLETSDPVLGGAGGIANRQAEQLANRTAWLKAKIDAFIDGTVAVLKATKLATARTLSISGAGSGSAPFDGSADANIVLTLADSGVVAGTHAKVTVNAKGLVTAGAALASADIPADLALTGNPSAPTPAQFDNDGSLATTEFVQRALGNHKTVLGINSGTVLTASAVGSFVSLFSPGAFAVTLPLGSSVPVGSKVSFFCISTPGQVFIQRQGTDQITLSSSTVVTGIDLYAGDVLEVVWTGTSWAAGGSIQAKYQPGFGSSLAINGYKKIPDANSPTGFIIEQWGSFNVAGSSTETYSFPVAFPNACRAIVATFGIPALGTINADALNAGQYRLQNTHTGTQGGRWKASGY